MKNNIITRTNYKEIFIEELMNIMENIKKDQNNYGFVIRGTTEMDLANPKDPIQKGILGRSNSNIPAVEINFIKKGVTSKDLFENLENPQPVLAINCQQALKPEYQKEYDRAENLIAFFKLSIEDCEIYHSAYDYFTELSEWLLQSTLIPTERFKILFEVLEKNINSGIYTKNGKIINAYELEIYQFKTISPKLSKKMIKTLLSFNFEEQEKIELTTEQREEWEYVIRSLEEDNPDNLPHIQIKENYLDIEVLTDENIAKILEALGQLRVKKKLIRQIRSVLEARAANEKSAWQPTISKEENTTNKTTPINSGSQKETHIPSQTNQQYKEQNIILKTLREYIDTDTLKPKRPLTLKERIAVVVLMKQLNFTLENMNFFLNACLNNQYAKDVQVTVILEEIFKHEEEEESQELKLFYKTWREETAQELESFAITWGKEKEVEFNNIKDTLEYYYELIAEIKSAENEYEKIENPYEKARLMEQLETLKKDTKDLYKEFEKQLKTFINEYIMQKVLEQLSPKQSNDYSSPPKQRDLTKKESS